MKVGAQVDGHRKPPAHRAPPEALLPVWSAGQTERLYPFQLSGGMARRVLVSTALLTSARLIIADEPTPGMSLEQAEEALAMFRAMADEGKGVVLITHDIDLAFPHCRPHCRLLRGDHSGNRSGGGLSPGAGGLRHPYSKALWRALPQHEFRPIPGFQPYAGNLPSGCLFAPRCPCRTAECEKSVPPMQTVRKGEVRCFHAT